MEKEDHQCKQAVLRHNSDEFSQYLRDEHQNASGNGRFRKRKKAEYILGAKIVFSRFLSFWNDSPSGPCSIFFTKYRPITRANKYPQKQPYWTLGAFAGKVVSPLCVVSLLSFCFVASALALDLFHLTLCTSIASHRDSRLRRVEGWFPSSTATHRPELDCSTSKRPWLVGGWLQDPSGLFRTNL